MAFQNTFVGWTYLMATDRDAQSMILHSVHASTRGAILVENVCLRLLSRKGRTPESFTARACYCLRVEWSM